MKIKDLFKQLEQANELNKSFNRTTLSLNVYFNSWDNETFRTYKDFIKYVKGEYVEEYIDILLNTDGEDRHNDDSVTFEFECLGHSERVEFWLE